MRSTTDFSLQTMRPEGSRLIYSKAEKMSTNSSIFTKIIPQKWKRNQDISR